MGNRVPLANIPFIGELKMEVYPAQRHTVSICLFFTLRISSRGCEPAVSCTVGWPGAHP